MGPRSIEIKYQLLFGFLAGCPPKKSCSTDKKAARIRIFLNNIGIFLPFKSFFARTLSLNKLQWKVLW